MEQEKKCQRQTNICRAKVTAAGSLQTLVRQIYVRFRLIYTVYMR